MNSPLLDVVVIGAGHAGLCISKLLADKGINHQVFERGKIADSWRSQRWTSFKMNSVNRMNLLPGQTPVFNNPEAFSDAPEFAGQLEAYAQEFKLPVSENTLVTSVEKNRSSHSFSIEVLIDNVIEKKFSRCVVVASGGQNEKSVPKFAKDIEQGIVQQHASEYKAASLLPPGAVLVAGSGQSGIQIAEDLTSAGRKVFICTCKVGRIPRTYRGKDIFDWMLNTGLYDVLREEASLELLNTRSPQVSGAGIAGKTCSLQSLAKNNAVILGKMENANGDTIHLQPNAADHVLYADEFSIKLKKAINEYIHKQNITAPTPYEDPNDFPDEGATCASRFTTLSLRKTNITSVIWATGFTGNFSYLKLPVFNQDKTLKHNNGISGEKGLYFLGLPWLRKRKSGIILGIEEDASFILEEIIKFLAV